MHDPLGLLHSGNRLQLVDWRRVQKRERPRLIESRTLSRTALPQNCSSQTIDSRLKIVNGTGVLTGTQMGYRSLALRGFGRGCDFLQTHPAGVAVFVNSSPSSLVFLVFETHMLHHSDCQEAYDWPEGRNLRVTRSGSCSSSFRASHACNSELRLEGKNKNDKPDCPLSLVQHTLHSAVRAS